MMEKVLFLLTVQTKLYLGTRLSSGNNKVEVEGDGYSIETGII